MEATSAAEAARLLVEDPARHRPIAGGTDLLGEIKEGTVSPEVLVSLQSARELARVEVTPEGIRLGALVTIAEIEHSAEIARDYTALAQAAASVATPQVRNVGTLGGNLCQRPRCWYYRSRLFDCRKKGGTICFAINGNNKYHAILGGHDCFIVHPSDTAVALLALGGQAIIAGPAGTRTLPMEEFFVGPDRNMLGETALQPGEVLAQVFVPRPAPGTRSLYLKVRERQTEDFALASVALAAQVADGVVRGARVALGGVAPVPWRAREAEDALRGVLLQQLDARKVGEAAVSGARPLKDNSYKVSLTSSLVGRAVRTLLQEPGA